LALVRPVGEADFRFEAAVRLVLFEIWYTVGESARERELEPILAGTWTGSVLERMKAHHRERMEEQRTFAESQDPERVRERRDEKRRLRQEKHAERLAAIIGENSEVTSAGFVFFLVGLEEKLEEMTGHSIILTEHPDAFEEDGPFSTVQALVQFIGSRTVAGS
jgi:hypothetical protein